MRIAIEGCGHGQLDKIYESIQYAEKTQGIKVDLLICCGDFQAVRNKFDLNCMAVPAKYRHMGDFYAYYKGEKVAPILTLFIHGNHEAGNHLQELYAGGWVAPNIYFMGYSNVIQFAGLRIGGLGGIFRDRYYNRGYFEKAPYDAESLRSVYYVREYEVWKLKHYRPKIDVFISHDWPLGIYHAHCDLQKLVRSKPFFEQEIKSNTLGSAANREVLMSLKPKYWFSAHLHVKFAAVVDHSTDGSQEQTTKFLALDKCLPRRDYLQILEFPDVPDAEKRLKYDPEWLAILKASLKYYSTSRGNFVHPAELDISAELKFVHDLERASPEGLAVPLDFEMAVPAFPEDVVSPISPLQNPQTSRLFAKLGVDISDRLATVPAAQVASSSSFNPEEIDLDEQDDADDAFEFASATSSTHPPANPEEIDLDDM